MQEFDPLMKAGKHKDAEAVLDRALKLLRSADKQEPKKSEATKPSKAFAGNGPELNPPL